MNILEKQPPPIHIDQGIFFSLSVYVLSLAAEDIIFQDREIIDDTIVSEVISW